MASPQYKVVLLGEGRVGKTSLVSRFVKDHFSDSEASTVQANMYSKLKLDINGKAVDVSIWDTAGQERFHALGPIYYRNSHGAVLVYDITDPDTFERVKMWLRELRSVVGDDIRIVLCGNKGDLENDREVPLEMANEWAKSQGALHFTTSAKSALNVKEAFTGLVESIVERDEVGAMLGGSKKKRSKKGASSAIGGGGGAGLEFSGSRPKKRGVKIDMSGSGDNVAPVTEASSPSYDDDFDEPEPVVSPPASEPAKPRSVSLSQPVKKDPEAKKKKKCDC